MPSPPSLDELRSLSEQAGLALGRHGRTIALAESCTGGLVASILTDVAGSSTYVAGGVVTYSNAAKMALLGVSEATLLAHGAVSAETAAAMAMGARHLFGCDIAIAVTGIAGPGGGDESKPVGLVYLHLAAADARWGERHMWPHDRIGNKQASVAAALQLLLRYLQPERPINPNLPVYLDRPVVVEASWREDGWRVQAVWMEGVRRVISGQGRTERTADGVVILVESSDGARLELLLDEANGQWRVLRLWPVQRHA